MSGEQENVSTSQESNIDQVGDPTAGNLTEGKQAAPGDQLPQVSVAEAKALQKGWQTKADWTESGKDPDEWISANHFNKNGEMFSQMQRLKSNAKNQDQRIADNNVMWKTQIEMQKQELLDKRDDAIEDSNKDEVKKLDSQINQLDQQAAKLTTAEVPQLSQEDAIAEQTYFNSLNPGQQPYAQQVAQHFINQGLFGEDLVNSVSAQVIKQFPPTNPRREKAPATDNSKRTSKIEDGKMTVDNLTSEQKAVMQSMRNVNARYAKKSDAEMIKILEDSKL